MFSGWVRNGRIDGGALPGVAMPQGPLFGAEARRLCTTTEQTRILSAMVKTIIKDPGIALLGRS